MTLSQLRRDALDCFAAAVDAVEPRRLVAAWLRRVDDTVSLGAGVGAHHAGPVLVVGAGKAARSMAEAVAQIVGSALRAGVIVVPRGLDVSPIGAITVEAGGHPVPDAAGEAATRRLLDTVASADPTTLVLVVLSGGASALLVAPASGVELRDKQDVTRRLLLAGADIAALNTVRKHCSRVKGGGLLRAAAETAGVWTLVLSDVIGDAPDVIGSGPTVADPSTFTDAAAALGRFLAPDDVPLAVRRHVERGLAGGVPETLKAGDPLLSKARTVVVGRNRDAVAAVATAAKARGYDTSVVADPLHGDAASAGRAVAGALAASRRDRPVAVVGGGETTVRVVGDGRGGRCQHLALTAATLLAGTPAVLLAAGTDGVDGPTDAAGACVDGETTARVRSLGFDAAAALARTDSHPLLDATGDLVRTGLTGTNVADVVVALRAAC